MLEILESKANGPTLFLGQRIVGSAGVHLAVPSHSLRAVLTSQRRGEYEMA